MKGLVVLLGLITATLLPGVAAIMGEIRAYNATGEVDITNGPLILGTRVNLTCNLTSPPSGSEVLSYRWYHNCRSQADSSCDIQNGDTYRVRNDTLSMNVTSYDQEGRYTCAVQYGQMTVLVPGPFISMAGGTRTPTTPTSVVTRASPTPTPGVTRASPTPTPVVTRASPTPTPVVSRASPTPTPVVTRASPTPTPVVTRASPTPTPVVTRASPTPTPVVTRASPTPTPVVSRDSPTPTPAVSVESSPLTPVDSRASPSSTPVDSGESQIPTPDVSRESSPLTPVDSRASPSSTPVDSGESQFPTPEVSRESSPPTPVDSEERLTPTPVDSRERPTPTPVLNTTPTTVSTTTTARNTSNFSPTSSGPQNFSRNPFNTQPVGTFIGVGVGVAMFLLLVLLTSVVVLILVVVVRRKGAHKLKRSTPLRDNLWCDNSVVAAQEMEMIKKGVTADNGDGYNDVDYNDKCEDDDPVEDVVNHYEFADRNENITNTNIPAQKEPFTSASATNVPVVYTVVDKSKKKEPKAMAEIGSFASNNVQYAMPMKKGGKMTHKEVVGVICAVEEEQYDDTVAYKPKEEQYDDTVAYQPKEEQYDDTVAYKPKADSKI